MEFYDSHSTGQNDLWVGKGAATTASRVKEASNCQAEKKVFFVLHRPKLFCNSSLSYDRKFYDCFNFLGGGNREGKMFHVKLFSFLSLGRLSVFFVVFRRDFFVNDNDGKKKNTFRRSGKSMSSS